MGISICGSDRATTPFLRSEVFVQVRAGLEIRFRRLPSWCDGYRAGPARAARRAPRRPRATRRPPPHRYVRPGRHRPPHLSDRPLQPPLHLLHARRGPRMDATRRAAHRRRARPAHHDRRARPRRSRAALHRWRTTAAPRPRTHHRGLGGPASASGHLAHHQRHRPRPPRRGTGRRGGQPAQRLDGHAAARPVRHHHAPQPPRRRPRRSRRRPRHRPPPRQDQYGAAARRQRRRGRPAAAIRPRPGL